MAYFQRLVLTPHPETAEEAARDAERAKLLVARADLDVGIGAFDALDALLEPFREEAALNELSPTLRVEAERLFGALFGELLCAQVGGTWGVGSLFGEPVPAGLLLGPRRIKVWPRIEIRTQIDGRASMTLAERAEGLIARATADRSETPAVDDSARVYALAPGQRWFDVGQCADGRQALMAAFETGTLGVFFDAQGRLLECAAVGPERLRADPKTGHADASHLRAWQAELGFTPCEIRVRKFHDARQHIGIEPLPAHYEDFLEDPESEPDPAIRRRTEAQIRAWIANGCFVLYWGSDLWLDADGVVTSS